MARQAAATGAKSGTALPSEIIAEATAPLMAHPPLAVLANAVRGTPRMHAYLPFRFMHAELFALWTSIRTTASLTSAHDLFCPNHAHVMHAISNGLLYATAAAVACWTNHVRPTLTGKRRARIWRWMKQVLMCKTSARGKCECCEAEAYVLACKQHKSVANRQAFLLVEHVPLLSEVTPQQKPLQSL
jgi:hypothetical protein